MKHYSAVAAIFALLLLSARGDTTNLLFDANAPYFNANPSTNRTVTLQPLNPFTGNLSRYTTDVNGQFTSVVQLGTDYDGHILQKGTAADIHFQVTVTTNILAAQVTNGAVKAETVTTQVGLSTYPASGRSSYTVQAMDAKLAALALSSGGVTYPDLASGTNAGKGYTDAQVATRPTYPQLNAGTNAAKGYTDAQVATLPTFANLTAGTNAGKGYTDAQITTVPSFTQLNAGTNAAVAHADDQLNAFSNAAPVVAIDNSLTNNVSGGGITNKLGINTNNPIAMLGGVKLNTNGTVNASTVNGGTVRTTNQLVFDGALDIRDGGSSQVMVSDGFGQATFTGTVTTFNSNAKLNGSYLYALGNLIFKDGNAANTVMTSDGSGSVTFAHALTAATLAGNGSGLTALNAAVLASGLVPTARLGSGTADGTTFLRGDSTWATAGVSAAGVASQISTNKLFTGWTNASGQSLGTAAFTAATAYDAAGVANTVSANTTNFVKDAVANVVTNGTVPTFANLTSGTNAAKGFTQAAVAAVISNNANGVTLGGTFTGNGAGLTNLNGTFATNVLGYITPQQYGAGGTPDGVTDNTVVFQLALNDSAYSGKTFFIPAPVDTNKFYLITRTLYVTNNVMPKINGGAAGLAVNNGGIIGAPIHYTGTGKFMVISNGTYEQDGFKMEHFQVYCVNTAEVGIWQAGPTPTISANDFTLNDVYMFNCKTSYVFRALGNSRFVECHYIASYGFDFGADTGAANFSVSFEHCAGGGNDSLCPQTNGFTINSGIVELRTMDINCSDLSRAGLILNGFPNVSAFGCNFENTTTNGQPNIMATNINSGAQLILVGGKAFGGIGPNPGPFLMVGASGMYCKFQGGQWTAGANSAGTHILSYVPANSGLNVYSDNSYTLMVSNVVNAVSYPVPSFGSGVDDTSYFTPPRWRTVWSYLQDSPNDALVVGFNTNGVATKTDLLKYSKDVFALKVANPQAVNTFVPQQKFNNGTLLAIPNGFNTGYKLNYAATAVEFGTAQLLVTGEWYIAHGTSGNNINTMDIYDDIAGNKITITPNTVFSGTITGNGSGITNLQHAVIQTNFISGKSYVNSYGTAITVSGLVSLTVTATAGGFCNLSLRNDAAPVNGGWTNLYAVNTTALSIVMSYTNAISLVVPTNASFTFTNLSTGGANSATVVGGQITY